MRPQRCHLLLPSISCNHDNDFNTVITKYFKFITNLVKIKSSNSLSMFTVSEPLNSWACKLVTDNGKVYHNVKIFVKKTAEENCYDLKRKINNC